jgi:cytochrome c-type biogenesis protein CcmH/NrfG
MPSPALFRRPVALVLLVAALAGAGAGLFFLLRKPPAPALPGPDSPAYQEYADLFQVGVAALDVDRFDLANTKLTAAIQRIPEEPAAWADRGLIHLRNNELKEAETDLNKAHELAPDSPEIESLLGRLAEKGGRFAEAADHYRKALASDPQDVTTRYALASVLDREGGPEGEAEYQKQLEEILRAQPNNLFVLGRLADVAARRADEAALRGVLDRYRKLAPSWSADTRKRLDALGRAAAGPLPGQVPAALVPFDNLLRTELGYSRDRAAAEPAGGTVGEPVRRFLRLQPLRPTAAAPDTAMTFAAEPIPAGPAAGVGRWDVVLPVWLTGGPEVAVFVANGQQLRRIDAAGPALDFPGGPKSVPPTRGGVLPLDWDNDYRTDFLLAGAGGLRFYHQAADGRFADVTDKTGLDPATLRADYYGAWAADFDLDGDLDIIAAPRRGPPVVLRNNRDGTFTAVKPFADVGAVRDFVWADFDNDGAPDAAFLDAEGGVHVFANERAGQFRKRELPAGLGKGAALAATDVNNDGVFDLLILQANTTLVGFSDKDKGRSFDVALAGGSTLPGPIEPGAAVLFAADLDNNGGLDLIASTDRGTFITLSREPGIFIGPGPASAPRVAAAVDLGRTGRLDLLALSDSGQPLRLVNKGTKDYHWQAVRPHATRKEQVKGDNRINSFAVGGEVEVRSGTLVEKQVIAAPVVHFGLGERRAADVIRVQWPNGTFQYEFEPAGDQLVEAEQRLKGSCPFLFAWDGSRMAFVTDFMWSTPLGMYIQAQDKGGFLQTTDWVKVRGDQLVPRDGYYDLRVLANLWETHYYDHMALIVVDHPPGTEIYTDERFFLTPTAPEVIVAEPPHPVARARDDHGDDVTEAVRAIDGKYLDTCGRGRFQGITRDHWVEADLGDDAPAEGPVWLVANGWVHPTDSSVNYAIEQGSHDRPRGLELEVPDGRGGWTVGRPALGFPAGKSKTILIRLDGIAGPGVTRRFRLRTNMEVYWDFLGWARGLDAGLARQRRLLADEAELRFHGVVAITQADASSPELPHYDRLIGTGQYWRDLIGYYTRFGDVREPLAAVDDRYVIMNAGDEIAMRFCAPDDPPPGWRRDFIWVCDGWAKDGDLNTRFSKTVLPLPAHDLTSYVTPPGRLEDDPVYRRFPQDWQKYHTRYVTTEVYDRGLRPFRRPRP